MKKTLRFLIADDDQDDLDLFASLVKELLPEADIITASDGTDVVAWLDASPVELLPDVLVLDFNMPKMNGAQVLDHICAKPRFHGMVKFILSTSAQQGYIDGCLNKGAIEYFIKPNGLEDLRSIVIRITSYVTTISRSL